jgi:4-coumarate--CoA ligase (photoactive yellow protein activation family)
MDLKRMDIENIHPLCKDFSANSCREIVARRTCFADKQQSQAQNAPNRYPGWDGWVEIIQRECGGTGFGELRFSTSGSTGLPVLWPFTPADIREETRSLQPFFADRTRVVSVMPRHHVFGFVFALMLPKALGIPSLQLPPMPTAHFFRELRGGDLLLAFPVFWQALLKIRASENGPVFPADLRGVTSSAPCPPEVAQALLGPANGTPAGCLAQLTEIYGATEFGAVGIRQSCRQPYALLPHWQRVPLFDGEGAFSEWGIKRASGKAMPLPDTVRWTEDRSFTPAGRKDRAVQVGGRNVFPGKVAELLQRHPEVRECAVRLMRPEEGVRLKAFVAPRSAGDARSRARLAKEIRTWLAQRLSPAETPKSVLVGEELPRTASGKPADWPVTAKQPAGGSPVQYREYTTKTVEADDE